MIKVLIADDHPVVRQGIKQIISDTTDIIALDEAQNSNEVLSKIRVKDYDIILLDITMPDQIGLEMISRIRQSKAHLPILVLTMHSEEELGQHVIRAGADGYLTKDKAPIELIEAIRKVAAGRKYISPTLAEILADVLRKNVEKPKHYILSKREFEIMSMIANGKKLTQIAKELSISPTTVSAHRAHILSKMNMTCNAEIVSYAINNCLLNKTRHLQ